MPGLQLPTVRVRRSFLAAIAEFQAEGRGQPGDQTSVGNEIRAQRGTWTTLEGFERYVQAVRDQSREDAPRPAGYVPCTTFWWVDDTEYLRRIAVRHRLNDKLRVTGGHIGYDVRPSARRRGHATAMLRAVLPMARQLGISSALVTCDTDNIGSRRAIQRNRGILDDERDGKLRFWVPTDVVVVSSP